MVSQVIVPASSTQQSNGNRFVQIIIKFYNVELQLFVQWKYESISVSGYVGVTPLVKAHRTNCVLNNSASNNASSNGYNWVPCSTHNMCTSIFFHVALIICAHNWVQTCTYDALSDWFILPYSYLFSWFPCCLCSYPLPLMVLFYLTTL
jgi:hypothetical protein